MAILHIGIDPGVKTGFAVYNETERKLTEVSTLKIHKAMDKIIDLSHGNDVFVYFEDARLRKWYGRNSNVKQQGAGSIKRDCLIWMHFLDDLRALGVIKGHKGQHPIKGATKTPKNAFERMTGYKGRTSEHGRDAAMIVFKASCYTFNLLK